MTLVLRHEKLFATWYTVETMAWSAASADQKGNSSICSRCHYDYVKPGVDVDWHYMSSVELARISALMFIGLPALICSSPEASVSNIFVNAS